MQATQVPLAVVLIGVLVAPAMQAAESPYWGAWTNEDPVTQGVTRVSIEARNGKFVFHAWGSCHPQECNWGEAEGTLHEGRILVRWTPWFAVVQWQVILETPLRLRISDHTHFIDKSGRPDSNHTFFFGRACESREETGDLPAPMHLSPESGAKFDFYPRRTNLEWETVSGAAAYTVEVDCLHCCRTGSWCADVTKPWRIVPSVRDHAFQFEFVGAQRGRWRVCAVDATGRAGARSAWSEFFYAQ